MDLSQRQSDIVKLVQNHGHQSVERLADQFDVTSQTIRRDVNHLCDLGLVRRVHGGVDLLPKRQNLDYSERQILNIEQKTRIANAVASRVPDGTSIAFGIGTTPEVTMRALTNHNELRIFTNNLNVAMIASSNPSFDVTIVGGRVRHGDRDILGAQTEQFFDSYKFDIGIFGVGGIDDDGVLLDFNEEEVAARQAISRNCRQTYLTIDHTKFGRAAHVRGGNLSDADVIFSDRNLPDWAVEIACKSQSEIVICDGAETGYVR
jgi:DeoR family glycerol-3-phosphate regulon repressor